MDRSVLLYVIDSRTKEMTDREVTSFLKILWNADSTLLATHDDGAKHSRLDIHRIVDSRARRLDIPDLRKAACRKLSVKESTVTASGQTPTRWIRPDLLEVSVKIVTAKGKFKAKISVLIGPNGEVSVP